VPKPSPMATAHRCSKSNEIAVMLSKLEFFSEVIEELSRNYRDIKIVSEPIKIERIESFKFSYYKEIGP